MNSICIATYNGEKYIKEQLDSILTQVNSDDEIIISDDGSSDSTLEIITGVGDSRVRILKNEARHGCIGNFENALRNAKGKYIFLSDQDDVWFPNKYSVMLNALCDNVLVHHDSVVTNDKLEILYDSFYELYNCGVGIIKNIIKSTYFGSHMAFDSKLLSFCIPFPNTNEIGHDLWIGLVAESLRNKVAFIPDKLMYYRRHENSFCSIYTKSDRRIFFKLKGRILMMYFLSTFILKNAIFRSALKK